MNLWTENRRTGRYPPLRVIWNLIWVGPIYIARALFAICILAQSLQISEAVRAWDAGS